jgi:MIP family channel proteins
MFLTGRLTPLRFLIYVIGQLLGAFLAAVIVFVLYLDALKSYGENMHSLDTAGIFGTYPGAHLSIFGGLFDQTFGTFILVLVVLAITDKKNVQLPHGTVAILVGFTIFLIGTAFAYNCGYAVNPARDFAPRLFTLMAGWGTKTFTAGTYFFWIPIVGPLLGALVAVFVYIFFISAHWPQTDYL